MNEAKISLIHPALFGSLEIYFQAGEVEQAEWLNQY